MLDALLQSEFLWKCAIHEMKSFKFPHPRKPSLEEKWKQQQSDNGGSRTFYCREVSVDFIFNCKIMNSDQGEV